MKTIVIIGGGSATFTLLKGLRQFPTNNIVIVSTADSGGSTGILRKDLGVMPWGDIRQCLIGLSYTAPALKDLFNYRFDTGSLKGHSAGNIILAALQKTTGSPESAIAEAARLLNVRGEVLFASQTPTTLSAKLANGTIIKGEHEIDEPVTKSRSPIVELRLSSAEVNPRAIDAIGRADAIILGPGDLYTSTFPNLLVPGIDEAIAHSKAKKIAITNVMTKLGQTDKFKASNFIKETNRYLHQHNTDGGINVAIVNTKKPAPAILALYRKEKAVFVEPDIEVIKKLGLEIIAKPLITDSVHKKANGDKLKRSIVKHDSEKTAELIWNLIK